MAGPPRVPAGRGPLDRQGCRLERGAVLGPRGRPAQGGGLGLGDALSPHRLGLRDPHWAARDRTTAWGQEVGGETTAQSRVPASTRACRSRFRGCRPWPCASSTRPDGLQEGLALFPPYGPWEIELPQLC